MDERMVAVNKLYQPISNKPMKQKTILKAVTGTMFLIFVTFIARAREFAELAIVISDCREPKSYAFLKELRILKNGIEYTMLYPKHENKQVLKNLELGTYSLVYTSMFGKEETQIVEITENKKYSTNVCIDFIDYTKESYVSIIDQLQESESYSIVMLSQGCFHFTNDTVLISRTDDTYSIKWGSKTKVLSEDEIEKIRHFEIELNYMNDSGGCTTTDSYQINYNDRLLIQIDDGSCAWNGNRYLKMELFGEE